MYMRINYCIEVFGSAAQYHINSLVVLQKRAVRVITSSKFREHTAPLFKDLKLLTLQQLYLYRIGLFMFKVHHNKVPDVCQSIFVTNANVHSYNTRRRNHLHVPIANSVCLSKCIRIKGVKIWNKIMDSIDVQCSIACFKHKLRNFLPMLIDT